MGFAKPMGTPGFSKADLADPADPASGKASAAVIPFLQATTLAAANDVLERGNATASVASATTTDLGAVASSKVLITGTTTITGFGTCASGTRKYVRFNGALTLTHNATSLILPGGANITTAAGDTAEFNSAGSGNWRCIWYQRADGKTLPAALASAAQAKAQTATDVAVTPSNLADFAKVSIAPVRIANKWYSTLLAGTVGAGAALPGASIRLYPFVVPVRMSVQALGARITTAAASGNIQLALYASDATTTLPTGNALCSTGSISTTSTGVVSAAIAGGGSITLTPGLYWGAVNTDATAAATVILQFVAQTSPYAAYFIGSATLANVSGGATAANFILTVAQVYNTWPDLTSGSFTESVSSAWALLFLEAA